LISNRQSAPVDENGLSALARECLAGEGAGLTELSLSFVTAGEIADLHVRYVNEEGPTDVLSFEMDEESEGGGVRVLGDVVIAPSEAAKNNPDMDAELRLLVVHGILHLLGYDHEEADERAVMWEHQERYVETKVQ
jgi:probable rRNA maturation factor